MALVTRALTGSVILPDGTPVSSGQVKFFPVGQLPADMDALLVRSGITLSIVDGEISGNIVAPCNYRILVYSGTSRVVSFRGGITETDPHDPLTLQQIYAANVDADDVVIIQGPQGDQGLPGNDVHSYFVDEPGALIDGTLAAWIAAAGTIDAADGLVGTDPDSDMTLSLYVDSVEEVVITWTAGDTTPSSITGLPLALSGGELLEAILDSSTGAADLVAYFRGIVS